MNKDDLKDINFGSEGYTLTALVGNDGGALTEKIKESLPDARVQSFESDVELKAHLASDLSGAEKIIYVDLKGASDNDREKLAPAVLEVAEDLGKYDKGEGGVVLCGSGCKGLGNKLLSLLSSIGIGNGASAIGQRVCGFTCRLTPEFIKSKGHGAGLLVSFLSKAIDKKAPVKLGESTGASPIPHGFIPTAFRIFLSSHSLKFLFSSCVAFAVDYILLLSLNLCFPTFEIAAVIAWVCSSMSNFLINRYFVFDNRGKFWLSMGEYYALAGVVFAVKTFVLLELFTRVFRIPLAISKLVAEVVMFVSNYIIQKKFIFRDGKKKE